MRTFSQQTEAPENHVERVEEGQMYMPPSNMIEVTVSFQNPVMPGNYLSVFRFVHGKDLEFGDKVYADIKVAEQLVPVKVEADQKKAEAMQRSEMMLDKFENLDKLEKSFEVDEDVKSIESNEIQIIMDDPVIKEVEPAEKTQIDNKPVNS